MKKLKKLKRLAPLIPANTCPYIDECLRIIDEIHSCYEDTLYKKGIQAEALFDERISLIKKNIEYIRESNDCLRQSSEYWYKQCKSIIEK